jgi:hypothetical protein
MPEMTKHRRGQNAGRGRFEPVPHDYGPHQDETTPRLVTIWAGPKSSDGTRDVPLPKALIAQRRHINNIAHEQARERAEKEEHE